MTSGSRACANWALKAPAWVRDWRRRFGAGYARSNDNTGTKQKAGIGFDAYEAPLLVTKTQPRVRS
jgi:hypothetical protein